MTRKLEVQTAPAKDTTSRTQPVNTLRLGRIKAAIWENKAKFDSIMTKLRTDAETAVASVKDEATFKAELPKVLQNCGACHNDFRKKSS